ncbi:hypothetical protein OAB00_04625 [Akkermansiaceae bacterium]|nr:hypothetical protein [Akkermansiaceae bacterium]
MKKGHLSILSVVIVASFLVWYLHPTQQLKRKSSAILEDFTLTEDTGLVSKAIFSSKQYSPMVEVDFGANSDLKKHIPQLPVSHTIHQEKLVMASQSLHKVAEILSHEPSEFTVKKTEPKTYTVSFKDSIRLKLKNKPINTTINTNVVFTFEKSKQGFQLSKVKF